jgi:arylsulfatase A-like enzyme
VPVRRRPCSARRRRDELAEQGADLLACFAARARPTTVVVTADHGECLGEEGLYGHAFHHEKVMEVPLLIFRLNAGSDPAEPAAPWRVA